MVARAARAARARRAGRVRRVRLATWNVNSLKVRMPRVEAWLAEVAPDVVCLQETKLADAAFPHLAFSALGYESAHHGQGQWNGVAILSKVGLEAVAPGFPDGDLPDPDARLLAATCGGIRVHSVYVPNGREVGHDHYRYKLGWLARLRRLLDTTTSADVPVVVAGDFNVAPADADVWSPAAFVGSTHVTPEERGELASLEAWGMTDVFRHLHPDPELYSYWDYRAGDFHQHRGMRIDLIYATAPVVARATFSVVDRNARKGQQPSDHAPVLVDLDEAA
jgi:exodeoxyribonuclease III